MVIMFFQMYFGSGYFLKQLLLNVFVRKIRFQFSDQKKTLDQFALKYGIQYLFASSSESSPNIDFNKDLKEREKKNIIY